MATGASAYLALERLAMHLDVAGRDLEKLGTFGGLVHAPLAYPMRADSC